MNNPRLKRILLIIGFVLFVLALGVIFWIVFFRPFFHVTRTLTNRNANTNNTGVLPNINANRATNRTNQPLTNGTGQLPAPSQVANGGVTLVHDVTSQDTFAPIVGPDGRTLLYYDKATGQFVQVDPTTGKSTVIAGVHFPDVQNITWAPDRKKAVLEFPDGRKITYDFSTKKQYSLPDQGEDFSFSPNSDQLAFKYLGGSPEQNVIATSDVTGSRLTVVQDIGDKASQVQVAWSPSSDVVAMFRQGTSADKQEVIFLGQQQENYKSLQTDGRGFQGKWTPDGNKLLYTVYSAATDWNPKLHLVRAQGDSIGTGNTDLGIQTFVDKCTFNKDGTHAYCAVPDSLDSGSGLYPEFGAKAKDTFYSIDLATGVKTPVADPVTASFQRYSVGSTFLSDDERTLYFTDQQTQRIHSIQLR